MNELVNLVVQKTGLPQATAQNVVNVVIDYLKKRLPGPIAGQIDTALNNSGNISKAEGMLGDLGSKMGKKK